MNPIKCICFLDKLHYIYDFKIAFIINFIILIIITPSFYDKSRRKIEFAKADTKIKSIEYNFLLSVSQQLDISMEDFEYLIKNPIAYRHLESYSERIVQFHRLVLLMNLNNERTKNKVIKLFNFGLRMGLSHESINKVLYLKEDFPNKIVPPNILIDIFKVQYN